MHVLKRCLEVCCEVMHNVCVFWSDVWDGVLKWSCYLLGVPHFKKPAYVESPYFHMSGVILFFHMDELTCDTMGAS